MKKKLKTVLVVYTDEKLNAKQAASLKRYAFNTSEDLKVGDKLRASDYTTDMQVVRVFSRCYKFTNTQTGALFNDDEGTTQAFPLRELVEVKPHVKNCVEFELVN